MTTTAHDLHIGEENLGQIAAEAASLCAAHWQEVEAPLHGPDYSFDAAHYATLEALNMLCILAVRGEGNNLLGYAAFCLTPCPHRRGRLTAMLDGLYLAPPARRGLTALHLLRTAETLLARRGASLVQYSSPTSRPCHALYRRLGAQQTESIWQKELAPIAKMEGQ